MTARERRSRRHLTDLFSGAFPGHALLFEMPLGSPPDLGDFAVSDRPVRDWVPWYVQDYLKQVQAGESLDDDSVPFVRLTTNTGVFASAFGSPIHVYDGLSTNAAARPILFSAAQADALPEPDIHVRALDRCFELARLMRRELGPEVPIGVPDVQSPFGIVGLVWDKADLLASLYEAPQSVLRLVESATKLLKTFLLRFRYEFPNCNLAHWPYAWAPSELGCWVSEDDIGVISPSMFEGFCLPSLTELSETFGGMFLHCCANADHQYGGIARIPNLRGLNRRFQQPGARPCIERFAPVNTVISMGWEGEAAVHEMLDQALPASRFLINVCAPDIEGAKPIFQRLRERCPRR